MTLSRERIRKLQEGRRRAQNRRDEDAIRRVLAYRAWLKAGSKMRLIPCVPTDADYDTARRHGAI